MRSIEASSSSMLSCDSILSEACASFTPRIKLVHRRCKTPRTCTGGTRKHARRSVDRLDRLRVRVRRGRVAWGWHPGAPRLRGRPRALAVLAARGRAARGARGARGACGACGACARAGLILLAPRVRSGGLGAGRWCVGCTVYSATLTYLSRRRSCISRPRRLARSTRPSSRLVWRYLDTKPLSTKACGCSSLSRAADAGGSGPAALKARRLS
eukprot:scaffold113319_cov66-Phaeocystis_antarctica.AAC.1